MHLLLKTPIWHSVQTTSSRQFDRPLICNSCRFRRASAIIGNHLNNVDYTELFYVSFVNKAFSYILISFSTSGIATRHSEHILHPPNTTKIPEYCTSVIYGLWLESINLRCPLWASQHFNRSRFGSGDHIKFCTGSTIFVQFDFVITWR